MLQLFFEAVAVFSVSLLISSRLFNVKPQTAETVISAGKKQLIKVSVTFNLTVTNLLKIIHFKDLSLTSIKSYNLATVPECTLGTVCRQKQNSKDEFRRSFCFICTAVCHKNTDSP